MSQEKVTALGRILVTLVATMLLQSGSSDAQEKSRTGHSASSTLHLTLDFDALTDEWLDRQQIQLPTERDPWKFLSGPFNREIVDAAQGRNRYIVWVAFLHDATLPERELSLQPDDPNADPHVLIAYRSLTTTVSRHEAVVTVYSVESPPEPHVLLTAHLQYDVGRARWDRVKPDEADGTSLSNLEEPQILFVADGDLQQGYWTSLAFTQDSKALIGTLQRNPASAILHLLGLRFGEVQSFDLTAVNKAKEGSEHLKSRLPCPSQILTIKS